MSSEWASVHKYPRHNNKLAIGNGLTNRRIKTSPCSSHVGIVKRTGFLTSNRLRSRPPIGVLPTAIDIRIARERAAASQSGVSQSGVMQSGVSHSALGGRLSAIKRRPDALLALPG